MQQHDTEAELAVLQLDQKNEEEAFIYFEGEIGDEKSISEVDGTTAIIGPKTRLNNEQYGWKRGPMLKVFVEGYEEADLYVQTYELLKPVQQ